MTEENPNDDHLPRTVTILYATETGTAQDVANRIARHCRVVRFQARVVNMSHYPLSDFIHEHFVVFVVSTTGSGQEPRSMTPLWNVLLRANLPTDLLEDIHFAVFGLGDTAYEKFCWPAKKLSRRMQSLGATEICPKGEGDEQHTQGIDGALVPWLAQLYDAILESYPLPIGFRVLEDKGVPPARVSMYKISLSPKEDIKDPLDDDPGYHSATVKCNLRLTAEDWFQDVRHVEFTFDHEIEYEPGDVAVINPDISSIDVDSFLICMGWENIANDSYSIEHIMKDQTLPDHLPTVTTLRFLFTRYLNINAVPSRSFFEIVRHFSSNDVEREKLEEFASPEGAEDLYDYSQKVRRTIREVLEEFRSVKIPPNYIFDVFPLLLPRSFSIASSSQRHTHQIHLCVAIVNYRTRLKIPRRGVCTSYLATLRAGDTLRIGVEKGFIKLPEHPATPVICVGPGTGVAPMRAVIEHRLVAGAKDNTLYFGCRSASKDQHYAPEWKTYSDDGDLVYRLAPSRDGPEGTKRTYVQDLMMQDSKRIWEAVDRKGAYLYISGSSNKMPAAVRGAVMFAAREEGGKTEEEAAVYVMTLEKSGRLIEESWS